MIFKQVDPPGAGSACSVCYGTGKTFGNVATPDYVSMAVSGIITGTAWLPGDGDPANGSFKLLQISPCSWQFSGGSITITLTWSLDGTDVDIVRDGLLQFESADSASCLIVGNNDFADSARNFSQGSYQIYL